MPVGRSGGPQRTAHVQPKLAKSPERTRDASSKVGSPDATVRETDPTIDISIAAAKYENISKRKKDMSKLLDSYF